MLPGPNLAAVQPHSNLPEVTGLISGPGKAYLRGEQPVGSGTLLKIVVAVAGGFDPLNGRGHLTHIQEARKLGDKLVVILSRDDQLVAKANKPSGTFYPDILDRIAILREMRSVDEVVVNMDYGMECAETLRVVRPDIFAKGGDRNPSTMPKCELEACRAIGCRIVYNVGDHKKTSSSELIRRIEDAE